MKRIIALILALVMATFTFVACGNNNGGTETNAPETNAPETNAPETNAPATDAPETDAPVSQVSTTYDRVILIGVDGGGAFFADTDTPNMDKIFADGAVTYTCQSATPSISAQCWGSMLHGVTPDLHRLTNSIVDVTHYDPESIFPSVFRLIRENDAEATLASFSTWNPINHGIIEEGLGVHKDTADNDEILTEKILAYLDENDPKMLFIQFDDCDGAGHGSGYGSEGHLAQVTTTDGYIGQIYDKYVEKGYIENTLFIVTADHGGTEGGSHGGDDAPTMNIIFAAAGHTVMNSDKITSVDDLGLETDMQIRDIASVVLYAFGIQQPDTYTAIVPSGVFEGYVPVEKRPVYSIEFEYAYRTKESTPTPAADSGNYITDVLADYELAYYLPLDGDSKDAFGGETEETGKLYFVDGYYGQGCMFDDGCITLWDYVPGTESYSISFWMKVPSMVSGDPAIISNKNWSSGNNPGFIFSLRTSDTTFNVGNGSDRMDFENALPLDFVGGWMHVRLVVDRQAGTVGVAYDFGDIKTTEIPESLKNHPFNAGLLNIGQDSTKKYQGLPAVLDDIVIVQGALTKRDLMALAEYYGVEK
ncbi:MAG: alkaline phosphatase family protein [Clostridia bacterium]|nr:alkaline phosphatase family protein [Clostridia bacterium]